jgi:hypothetical protein
VTLSPPGQAYLRLKNRSSIYLCCRERQKNKEKPEFDDEEQGIPGGDVAKQRRGQDPGGESNQELCSAVQKQGAYRYSSNKKGSIFPKFSTHSAAILWAATPRLAEKPDPA